MYDTNMVSDDIHVPFWNFGTAGGKILPAGISIFDDIGLVISEAPLYRAIGTDGSSDSTFRCPLFVLCRPALARPLAYTNKRFTFFCK